MPFKRRGRKRGMGRKRRGKGKKFYPKSGASGRKGVMVNRTAARLHTMVAPHFLTKVEYGFTGHQALGAGVGSGFSICMNNLNFPADQGVNANAKYGAAAVGGTVYPATLALNALNPVGHSQLSVLYSRCRVLASKIQITLTPDTNDTILAVGPSTDDVITAGFQADIQRAMSQPYHKSIQCTQTNNVKQNTISLYMDCPTVAGLTRQQYYDDDSNASIAGGAHNPSNTMFWNIYFSPYTAAISLSNNISIRITYWVEYFEPLPPTDI